MANPLRGEVPLPGTAYVMRFSVNDICAIEAETDMSFADHMAALDAAGDKVKVSDLRRWVRWGLMHAHPDMTDIEAGEIAGQSDGLRAVSTAIGSALRAALGVPDEGTTKPKKAQSRPIG